MASGVCWEPVGQRGDAPPDRGSVLPGEGGEDVGAEVARLPGGGVVDGDVSVFRPAAEGAEADVQRGCGLRGGEHFVVSGCRRRVVGSPRIGYCHASHSTHARSGAVNPGPACRKYLSARVRVCQSPAVTDATPPRWVPTWTLGDRLRKIRRDLGLDQHELAAELGVKPSTLSAWESGRNTPDDPVGIARRLEEITSVPAAWTLGVLCNPPDPTTPRAARSLPRPRLALSARV